MYICNTCQKPFGTERTRNHKTCPQCLGRRGGLGKAPLFKDKEAKLSKAGYLYYTVTMLTEDERKLIQPGQRTVLVHRFVMSQYIGRALDQNDVVMHINGNKQDNRIENLQLGDQRANVMQHWEAKQEYEKWRNLAALVLMMKPLQSAG